MPNRNYKHFFRCISSTGIVVLLLACCCDSQAQLVHLRSGSFDPVVQQAPTGSLSMMGKAQVDNTVFLVQFEGPVKQKWHDSLEAVGCRILGYLPEFAFIVEANSVPVENLRSIEGVRYVGHYHPSYKVDPDLLSLAKDSPVSVRFFAPAGMRSAAVQSLDAKVKSLNEDAATLSGLSLNEIVVLARDADVAWVEPYTEPELLNDVARSIMRVNPVWQDVGLYGEGQIIAVCDTGLDTGNTSTVHLDFRNRVVAGIGYSRNGLWNDPHGHGTHVAGSVLGSGTQSGSNPGNRMYTSSFAGAAPQAQLVLQSILDSNNGLTGLGSDFRIILADAYNQGARIHSNSWGAAVKGRYKINSQQVDDFTWNNRNMLVVFAAGNSGEDVQIPYGIIDPGSVGAPGTAKNCLTVGASENLRTSGGVQSTWQQVFGFSYDPVKSDRLSNNSSGLAAFSSRGPTVDGRFKPDIVAPGTNILSARSSVSSSSGWGLHSNQYYMYMGGTSMATPLTAGAAALVRQYFVQTRNLNNPSAALVKAALLNGAFDINPGQYGTGSGREIPGQRPTAAAGWGRVDVQAAIGRLPGTGLAFVDNQNGLTTGQQANADFTVTSASAPFRVTLVWTDYPSSEAAAKNLVNDLDLTVTSPGGVVYRGNGTTDRTNNAETVDILTPSVGVYTVRVTAHNVPIGPQPYALVITGGISTGGTSGVIGGTVRTSNGAPVSGVTISNGSVQAVTNDQGVYSITLPVGSNTLTSFRTGWTFTPASRQISVTSQGAVGIDFTASAAAGSIAGTLGFWKSQAVSSPNPYANNTNLVWDVAGHSWGTYTRVRFSSIDVESGYDYVQVLDSNGGLIEQFTGSKGETWSAWVPGNSVRIRLTSDSSITGAGFVISGTASAFPGVTINAVPGKSGLTQQTGVWTISGVPPGSYSVAPSIAGWQFSPVSESVTLAPAEARTNVDFLAFQPSSISGYVRTSTITESASVTASPNPYTDNFNQTWTINGPPGAVRMRVHFDYIDTEKGWDYVYVRNSGGQEVQRFDGVHSNVWSSWVTGNSIKIQLTSDALYSSFKGFRIDRIAAESSVTGLQGATVTITPGGRTATSAADGLWTVTGLGAGTYTVSAALGSWGFDPPARTVSLDAGAVSTGVDFQALEPGKVRGKVLQAMTSQQTVSVQSPNPYSNNLDQTFAINAPAGASALRIHFDYIHTEYDYDFLSVRDTSGTEKAKYSGSYSDVWTDWMSGDSASVNLKTDSSVVAQGFRIDRIEYQMAGGGVAGVQINASPGGQTALTAWDGSYTLNNLPTGIVQISATKTGGTFTPSVQQTAVSPGTTASAVFYTNLTPMTPGLTPDADFNNDGKQDILWQNAATGQWAIWNMDGVRWKSTTIPVPDKSIDANWVIAAVADFNRDGKDDILFHHKEQGGLVVWLMNVERRTAGIWLTPDAVTDLSWAPVGCGDFDADSQPDILWYNTKTGQLRIWLMNYLTLKSLMDPSPSGLTDKRWTPVGVQDFNGDSRPDILWRNSQTGQNVVWLMNGASMASYPSITPAVPDLTWKVRAIGDFNSDGKTDLAWLKTDTRDVAVWQLNGVAQTVGSYVSHKLDNTWDVKAAAKLAGGASNYLLWQKDTGQMAAWLMNYSTRLASVDLNPSTIPDVYWKVAAVNDFNRDGSPDWLWQHSSGALHLWLMNATGFSSSVNMPYPPSRDWKVVASGDFNLDSYADIVWQNTTTRQVAIWPMKANVQQPGASIVGVSPDSGWAIVGVGDFNLDGKPDLFWQKPSTRQLAVWYLNGTSFHSSEILPIQAPDTIWRIVGTGDYNSDGMADLLWRNPVTGQNAIWFLQGKNLLSASFTDPAYVTDTNWNIIGPR